MGFFDNLLQGGLKRDADPFTKDRARLILGGAADIFGGGTGAQARQGLSQLGQRREGQELLSGLFGGASAGGAPMGGSPTGGASPYGGTPGILPGATSAPQTPATRGAQTDPTIATALGAIDGNPAYDLIREFEGFRETPYWDVNALRIGYGSDTTTTADGRVVPVTEGARVDRAGAERDLRRRIDTEFMPIARNAVGGDVYDGLNPNQQAALNSIAYNYGRVPESVSAAVRSGNPQAASQAISALGSHNEGVNRGRRNQEAALFSGGQSGGGQAPQGGGQQIDPQRMIQILSHPGISNEVKQYVASTYGHQAGPDPTSGMREYALAQQQGFQGSFLDYQTQKAQAGRASTTVNVAAPGTPPADTELRDRLMKTEGEQWAGYLSTGAQAAGVQGDMDLLQDLAQVAPQGPLTGRLAQAFPGFDSGASAFQAVVKRLAPTMRQEGSGSTSDIEYQGMLDALPSLSNRPEANSAIIQMMNAKNQINIERAQTVEAYQNGDVDAPTARRRLSEINSRSIMTPDLRRQISGLDGAGSVEGGETGWTDLGDGIRVRRTN